MMSRFCRAIMAWGALILLPTGLLAQATSQVTGRVTATATGQAMPGVQVVVKGTTVGTLTDASGNYTLRLPASATTLVFSYIGYRTMEVAITGPTVNASLEIQPIGLEGLVVTALGVTREKRELGYAVQDVDGDRLNEVPSGNVVSSLSGNAAGVDVASSTVLGGTARIVIRGSTSIAGDNQPLFIVDGVPIDNTSRTNRTGIDYGNAASDIDPNNIESVSILKGPTAAALYGSRAANGAVVITTKSGKSARGRGITASFGSTFETPLRIPEYQNLYGQGFNGQFRFVDGTGTAAGNLNDGTDESWGPRLDGRLIDQFTGPQQPWVPSPNNVRDFFELGQQTFMNISAGHAGERSDARLSISRNQGKGITPAFTLDRTSILLNGGVQVTERLKASASLNYVRTDGNNRTSVEYEGGNPMHQFVWFGRQVDTRLLKNRYMNEDGTPYNWNYNYWDNPYWVAYANQSWDWRNRFIGSAELSYRLTDWMNAQVKSSRDFYNEFRKRTWAVGSVDARKGQFTEDLIESLEANHQLLVTAQRELTPDFSLSANLGGNIRVAERQTRFIEVEELGVPGIYSLANAGVAPSVSDGYRKRQVNSVFGSAALNYKGFWSTEVTGRNDWSSTLPEGNNSFFYPSLSTALVFTDAFGLSNEWLSSGKIRAAVARVGNDTDPYQLRPVYASATPFDGVPGYSVPSALPNANLKPEETFSWEVGTDLGFLNERLGFVFTYYDAATRNQILNIQTASESGYSSVYINAGEVRNSGLELQLNATPVKLDNGFRWDVTGNWAKNQSEVVELYGDLPAQNLGSRFGMDVQARVGEPFGTMMGYRYRRNAEGKLIVGSNGIPLRDTEKSVLGNFNPDWTAGLINRFSYKNVDLSVVLDGKYGGEVFLGTSYYGKYSGVLIETLRGRENDVDPSDPDGDGLACDPGFIVDGVYADGTPNTTRVCPQQYYKGVRTISEEHMYDASFLKLREVRLGFRVPESLINRIGFAGANVALVGRNLLLFARVPHIDPEVTYNSGNFQGLEYGQLPTSRSIGFTVSVQP